ncbi:MAG: FecR domain-containing protein [Pirellulales bacterium]
MNAAFDPITAIDAWLDDELDAPGQHALTTWLEADAEHAAVLARRAFLHSRLRQLHGRLLDTPPAPVELPRKRLWTVVRDFANDYWTLSVVVATLTMTIILLSLALIVPDWGRSTPNVAEVDPPRPEVVAKITATHQADWDKSSDANFKNIEMFPGERLVLNSGLAEVTFADGTVALIEAPAEVRIRDANGCDLLRGQLTAVARFKKGFVVETTLATITDIGTEFSVASGDQGVDALVYSGEIVVQCNEDDGPPGERRVVAAGDSVRVFRDASGAVVIQDRDSAAEFVRGIPETAEEATSPVPGIVETTDALRLLAKTPADVGFRSYQTGNQIVVFAEQRGVELTASLNVDFDKPGFCRNVNPDVSGIEPEIIDRGTRVDSYLIHMDSQKKRSLRGSVRFARPILGVIVDGKKLNATDEMLGSPAVRYDEYGHRGLEGDDTANPNNDTIEISEDRQTLTVGFACVTIDQVRVLVAAE